MEPCISLIFDIPDLEINIFKSSSKDLANNKFLIKVITFRVQMIANVFQDVSEIWKNIPQSMTKFMFVNYSFVLNLQQTFIINMQQQDQSISSYFQSLSTPNNLLQLISPQITLLNNKYANSLSRGRYTLLPKQPPPTSLANQSQLRSELSLLRLQLNRVQSSLVSAESKRRQISLLKSKELEIKTKQATQLIERLRKEKIEFKKKIKMVDVQNRLKEKAMSEFERKIKEEDQSRRKEQKQVELRRRIDGIRENGVSRLQQMENFGKKYSEHIKSIICSNKRLYEKLEEYSKEKQRKQEERVKSMMDRALKKPTDWELIKRHQQSYSKLAKHYAIHNQNPIINKEQWKKYKFEYRSRSNPYLKRIEYKVPEIKRPRILTQTDESETSPKQTISKQERIKRGNEYLAESVAMARKYEVSNPETTSSNQRKKLQDYLPEVKNDIRQEMKRFSERIATSVDRASPQTFNKDQTYVKKVLQNIKKLDDIVQKKITLNSKRISQQMMDQDEQATSMYIKNIRSKLSLLKTKDSKQSKQFKEPKEEKQQINFQNQEQAQSENFPSTQSA